MEKRKKMRESNDYKWGAAHGYAGPDWRDEDVPGEEDTSSDGHDDNVVGEGPEEVDIDEEVALVQETNQSQYLVKVLWKNNHIGRVDVELRLGIDADTDTCLLKTRNIIETSIRK